MNKLFRSRTDSKLTGLCGGLAEWLGINATLIRLIVVIAALCSFGTVVLIYIIGCLLVPKTPLHPYDITPPYHS
ncbi:PspC domain-containing protein [Paenibacillus aceris]|uniref:Phage shock protein PspC (Stress-responsive transcriptional regulator) n=1 Tax=Paenibacillus aceris TaxID=869555 RepID=A0ABS4I1C3_9BACL|nr:PspC domain-containing protein [Paenibacillus aceris]MBP1964361.1 phage shock protein PspC (stress-responsive transcriptional regulator) [Paenibacillus aceris]NHW36679.1 PspC domain-containing protein [Paenibacillus aceris]